MRRFSPISPRRRPGGGAADPANGDRGRGIGQLAPFLPPHYRTTCAVSRTNTGAAGENWVTRRGRLTYRTTCAVWGVTLGQLAPFSGETIGQLAPLGGEDYRTTCAEGIGQLAPLGGEGSDNLRRNGGQTIGQLAPNYRTTCAVWPARGRPARAEGAPLLLTTSILFLRT